MGSLETEQTKIVADERVARSLGPLRLLGTAARAAWTARRKLFVLVLISQFILTFVAGPVVHWVFREALRASGMLAIDMSDLSLNPGLPITVVLLVLIFILVFWLLVLQFSAYLFVLRYPDGSWKQLLEEIGQVGRKVLRPSSLGVAGYLLVVLPLSGFGFTSTVIRGIAVPNFITGELEKEPLMRVALVIGGLLLAYLNLRLAPTMPIFSFSGRNGNASLRKSMAITRGFRPWPILVSVVVLLVGLGAAIAIVIHLSLLPTLLADNVAPTASPVVAAFSLGAAQIASLLLVGFTVALLAGVLTAYAQAYEAVSPTPASPTPVATGRKTVAIGWGLAIGGVVLLGVLQIPNMQVIAGQYDTVVIGHRGFTEGGVENTVESLEAANAAGAQFVELDAMQTKDGKFVVMHDTDLRRLAGQKGQVKDMTLDELTALTVHDEAGHTGHIPSLVEFVTRANELDQPLLIEIKLSGAETDTHVQDLIEVLEDNDLINGQHMFHTLDKASAETLKSIRPDLTVGYIMPFAGLAVPETSADFIVVEESSATTTMQKKAADAGLGYVVWTVDTNDGIRRRLREGVDAIITDHTDKALQAREEMDTEVGLAGRLHDMLRSLLV